MNILFLVLLVGAVDSQGSAANFVSVQLLDGGIGRSGVLVLAESESLRSAGFAVIDNSWMQTFRKGLLNCHR